MTLMIGIFLAFIYFSILVSSVQKNARPVHTSTVGQGRVVPSSGSMEVHPGAEPLHCFHGCRTEHILPQVLPNVVFIVLWNTGLCVRLLCFLERCLLCYGILMLCLWSG